MLSLLSPDVIDGLVVIGMFLIRIGLPIGIVLAFGYWLQRRLRPEDYEESTTLVRTTGYETSRVVRGPAWLRRVGREMDALPAWLPAIVLMMMVGAGAGIYRLWNGLGVATNLSQGYPWGLW